MLSDLLEELFVENRSLLDDPSRVVRKVARLEVFRACDAARIEIEGMHVGTKQSRREGEEAAAGADVQKAQVLQRRPVERRDQRHLGVLDLIGREAFEKLAPVPAEIEA